MGWVLPMGDFFEQVKECERLDDGVLGVCGVWVNAVTEIFNIHQCEEVEI